MSQVNRTSLRSSRRPSTLSRWLAVTAATISLVVPTTALGWSDPPGGISGPTSQGATTLTGLTERTATELAQTREAPTAASADEGFSLTDAGIGAGAVALLAALAGVAYAVRRRAHPSPRPAI